MKMTVGSSKRIVLPIIAAVFASLVVVMMWFALPSQAKQDTSKGIFTSFQILTFSSIEELSNASDAVVIGTVNGVVGHEINYGANPDEEYGIFKYTIHFLTEVYYEIDVTEILKGETAETIIVASPDMDQAICNEVTPLRDGEEVLLFLKERTKGEAPGLKLYEHFYWIVSLDNGVFDVVEGDAVQPRYAEAFVEPNEDGTFTTPTYNLSEVREKIQSVN